MIVPETIDTSTWVLGQPNQSFIHSSVKATEQKPATAQQRPLVMTPPEYGKINQTFFLD